MFRVVRSVGYRNCCRTLAPFRGFSSAQGGFDRRESLYEKLGVAPGASLPEIKRAFYQKAKDCHPDLHGNDATMAARFRALADAYVVLSDPSARRNYDESGIDRSDGNDGGVDASRTWKPGDGWSAEEMEGNQRAAAWKQVLQDHEVLRQAREEYLAELRRDLGEACEAALRGDASPMFHFARCHPGAVAAGLLAAAPVLVAVRSPHLTLLALKRLAAVEALGTKVIMSVMLPWIVAVGVDLPGKIWDARVAAARRAVQRRKFREAKEAAGADGSVRSDDVVKQSKATAVTAANQLAVHASSRSDLPAATTSVPNVVYLDDSSSMITFRNVPEGAFSIRPKWKWANTCLQAGHKELMELAQYLENTPTRVVKFGGVTEFEEYFDHNGERRWTSRGKMLRTLLLETMDFQYYRDTPLMLDAWDGSSQGTYMWKMIETDIMGAYQPGTPIRVHLITDGEDTHSPKPFDGIHGMDALKFSLRDKGYPIQWNITLLLVGAHSFRGLAARRYEELCRSSGGVFRILSDGYPDNGGDASLQQLLQASDTKEIQRRYEAHLLAARTASGDDIELPRLTR